MQPESRLSRIIAKNPLASEGKRITLSEVIAFLLLVKIFLNPFPQITAIHEICFYVSVLFLIVLIILKRVTFSIRTPLTTPFFLFVLWCAIGLPFAVNMANSLHDIYAHLIKYMVLFFLVVNFLDNVKYLVILMWTIVLSTVIFSLWQMISYYAIMGMPLSLKLKHAMPEEIPTNVMAVLTVFALCTAVFLFTIVMKRNQRIALVFCSSLLIIATLATQTMGAFLAMVFVLILSISVRKRTAILMMLILVIFIAFMPMKHQLTVDALRNKVKKDERISIWYTYGEIIKDYPILGVGFGMQTLFDESFLKKYNLRVPQQHRNPNVYSAPHNFVVDVATRTGIVGLLLYLYIYYVFLRMGWQLMHDKEDLLIGIGARYLMIAFGAVCIQGLFENTMSGPAAIILYTIFAMMTILWKVNQRLEGKIIEYPLQHKESH